MKPKKFKKCKRCNLLRYDFNMIKQIKDNITSYRRSNLCVECASSRMKICGMCRIDKSWDEYTLYRKATKNGIKESPIPWCHPCAAVRSSKIYKADPTKHRSYVNKWLGSLSVVELKLFRQKQLDSMRNRYDLFKRVRAAVKDFNGKTEDTKMKELIDVVKTVKITYGLSGAVKKKTGWTFEEIDVLMNQLLEIHDRDVKFVNKLDAAFKGE